MFKLPFRAFWSSHELLKDTLTVLIYCALIAVVIWITEAGEFWMTLQISLVFGAACLSCIRLSIYYLREKLSVLGATILGYFGGVIIGMGYLLYQVYDSVDAVLNASWSDLLLKVLFSMLVTYIFYNAHRLSRKERELQEQKLKTLMQEKQLAESNYQMLQSQIEPHFLFNTLANIQVLIDIRPDDAKRMLDDLTSLLRVSMSKIKQPRIQLIEELDLVAAYLSIQKVRMGDRLRFHIHKKGDVERIECPPFLLQPLVENAIVHGIEPSLKGGEIEISVKVEEENCHVSILDTGLGLAPNWQASVSSDKKHGIALRNIRQRLFLIYGDQAHFDIENVYNDQKQVSGCLVTLSWPLSDSQQKMLGMEHVTH
ncbi:sensor histidine kinase [Marinomonas fungiae]|uniref:Histidine kinase/Histidine kinase-, DNA gyrase B-, and HSP90-like ATPase n=1 Tax=Marinomonas fungiae TaxID=1137284 RepID=A0A0K6IM86_9GAMM|nr:histidine kinase [Marinomonas fungiae]CUB04201.1 Histidine kinase/Histidine kinase-, DNA gyrase B-, and HSP90-like ATPase [Marinomonas fungiae]